MDDLGPFSLPNSHSHEVAARSNGQTYQVWVATPSKPVPGQPFPVLYVLDGNWSFATVAETARMLQLSQDVPPLLVVGVGYPGPRGHRDAMRLRNFELTPTDDPAYRDRAATQRSPVDERGLGGAAGFLDFLANELAPGIEERYNASATDRALHGFSLGGLFGAYALLQERPAFMRFLIGSPSLWWNDRWLFGLEERRAEGPKELRARVFLTAGEEEERFGQPETAPFRMVSNAIEFAGRLGTRGYDGLELNSRVFSGEGHTASPILVAGLRWLYSGWKKE